jgi:hypothetical protein
MFHFRGKNNGWIITSRLFYLPCDGYTHGITIDVYITDINVSDEKSLGICQ